MEDIVLHYGSFKRKPVRMAEGGISRIVRGTTYEFLVSSTVQVLYELPDIIDQYGGMWGRSGYDVKGFAHGVYHVEVLVKR